MPTSRGKTNNTLEQRKTRGVKWEGGSVKKVNSCIEPADPQFFFQFVSVQKGLGSGLPI